MCNLMVEKQLRSTSGNVNDIAVKYLLRRCEACLTASEASSCDEVKHLLLQSKRCGSATHCTPSVREPNEPSSLRTVDFPKEKTDGVHTDISHGRILQVYISAYLFWERRQTVRSDEEGNSELYWDVFLPTYSASFTDSLLTALESRTPRAGEGTYFCRLWQK